MAKAFFIDLTRCTGCRGCQVACKQWKNLPAEPTSNTGSHANPPDLSSVTLKTVHMREVGKGRDLKLLFFPEQCRHCLLAPCMTAAAWVKDAIIRDEETGAVLFTPLTAQLDEQRVRQACPYDIPRADPKTGQLFKCDMCNDRVHEGMLPACVQTCPTGAMNFGEEDAMLALAQKRLSIAKKQFPGAVLGDEGTVRVIYLYAQNPADYHPYAVFADSGAQPAPHGATRRAFLAGLLPSRKVLGGLLLALCVGLAGLAPALAEMPEQRDLKRIGEVFRKPLELNKAENPKLHVRFDHKAHKTILCTTCHHEMTESGVRYTSCSTDECHSIMDRTDKDVQSRFWALHTMGTERSCYGCHAERAKRYNQFLGCNPCHAAVKGK